MASITSLMNSSSSTSSLYGNRNIISGLASGMDTEAMIENSISGYKTKITGLQQKMTKLQWKQDAYRSLITQMNNIVNKYASYTSSTNLLSSSFFSKAVSTVANGANASKVTVSGKGSSNVQIDRIKQLAQAATYAVEAGDLAANGAKTTAVDWNKDIESSKVSGTISIQYGGAADSSKGTRINLRFSEDEVFHSADDLAKAINAQLENITIGDKKASEKIKASVDADGKVTLEDKGGNYFEITGVSGGMAEIFEKGTAVDHKLSSKAAVTESDLVETTKNHEFLAEQSINVTLDGKTKTIQLKDIMESSDFKFNAKPFYQNPATAEAFARGLQSKIDEAFGSGKIEVSSDSSGALQFATKNQGSVLKVGGNDAVNEGLGLGQGGYSNVLQNGWTLERVLGADKFQPKQAVDEDGNVIVGKYLNAAGEEVTDPAEAAQVATLTINGKNIELNKDDTIQNMMEKINSSDAGVNVKYSTLTGEFSITGKETGAESQINISGELGQALFKMNTADPAYTTQGALKNGQDAVFQVTVNGKQMELSRSSNEVELDGYNVTLKDTFGYDKAGNEVEAEAITFQTNTDTDKIVDVIKDFVKDYNELATALRSAYRTEPLKNTKKEDYQPLTDDDKKDMSEDAIKAYEDKAKTGLLYADSDLANLYSKLTSAIQGGTDSAALRSIGLNITYSEGLSTLSLDEDALRSTLESDPDKVRDAFTKTTSSGAETNGLMHNIRDVLQQYGNTSIGSPGILVQKAGTTLSSYSLNNNQLNDQINAMQEEIEKWQDRMSDRVDFYTNQFTHLEMLINQMNSQSSMLAGLAGGM